MTKETIIISKGIAYINDGKGVAGIVDLSRVAPEAAKYVINVGADAAGTASTVYEGTQIIDTARDNGNWQHGLAQGSLSAIVGTTFGGWLGFAAGATFDLLAFKDKDGRGLGLLEASPTANLNYAHEFNFEGSPFYQASNTIANPNNPNPNPNYGNQGLGTPLQASILPFNYRGAGFNDPRLAARLESDIADAWNQSKEWTGDLHDPLAIDLDGDGIETIGADGTVVFDHNGDGVKTGTGWVVYPPAHAHRTGWQQPIRHV